MTDQDTLDTRAVLAAYFAPHMRHTAEWVGGGQLDEADFFQTTKAALIQIKDRIRKETWKELNHMGGD